MTQKFGKILSVLMLIVLLAGCAQQTAVSPAEPQVVEKTVIVKETSVVKETVKETVMVPATEDAALSEVQEFRVLDDLAYRSAADLDPNSEFANGVVQLLTIALVGSDTDALPVPTGLAESWEVNADNTSVTLKLRQNAKFSDGTPITANDVAWSLNYMIMTAHPDLYGKHNFFRAKRELGGIVGAQDVVDGKVAAEEFSAANVAGVVVKDDYTIQVDWVKSDLFLLNHLQNVRIVHPASVQAGKDKEYAGDEYWTTEKGAVWSGSYMLQSFGSGSGMSLVPNPNWYGPAPKISKITSQFVQDRTSAIAAFENKEADWVNFQLNPIDVANLGSDYLTSSLVSFPSLSVQQIFITPFKPMDDLNVRRAISMAIDRQALADVLGGGAGQTTYQVLTGHFAPANANCAEEFATVKGMPFDPAAAKAELAKSPYAGQTIELNMQLGQFGQPMSQDLIVSQVVQKMLQDNLGINVTIHQEPIPDFNKPPFATHLWSNEQGDHFLDQYAFMNNLAALNSADPLPDEASMGMVTLPRVPDMIPLMEEAANAKDLKSRCEALAKAQQVWVDQVYTIDLFTMNYSILIAPWVQGYEIANFGGTLMLQPGIENVTILKH